MNDTESKIIAAWRFAAQDLSFEFTSPFSAMVKGGCSVKFLGLVHHFGANVGMLIRGKSSGIVDGFWPADEEYGLSELWKSYCKYDRELFIDTLEDWGWRGPMAMRPSWYTGKS